jgi:hypothetical protein
VGISKPKGLGGGTYQKSGKSIRIVRDLVQIMGEWDVHWPFFPSFNYCHLKILKMFVSMVTSLILFKFDFSSQTMIYFCGNVIMYQVFYHFDHGLGWDELQQGQVVDIT